jgi:hypothetical protein
VKALAAKRSAALKKLNSTPQGRRAAQKMAKLAHQKSVAKKAAKAKAAKAKAVTGSTRPKPVPKPKKPGKPPACSCKSK